MNFKNSEFLMLVAAFLLGYFVQEMMKGCQVMEGLEESNVGKDDGVDRANLDYPPRASICQDALSTPPTPGGVKSWKTRAHQCLDALCVSRILPPPAATKCEKAGERCYDGNSCHQRSCGYEGGRDSISENEDKGPLRGRLDCNMG